MTLVPLDGADGRDRWIVGHDGRRFAVFVVDGEHFVTDAACPHNKGPLVEGTLHPGPVLVCPWHWFAFDLRTGRCVSFDRYQLGCYPVREVDGELFAEVPAPAPRRSWAETLRAHNAERRPR